MTVMLAGCLALSGENVKKKSMLARQPNCLKISSENQM